MKRMFIVCYEPHFAGDLLGVRRPPAYRKNGKPGLCHGKIFRFAESLMKNSRFFIDQP
jgi:hypothetical protein